ncbi:hypothetical protein MIMGU_mgv1a021759mg, partial [Erythranthe guttata]
MKEIGMHSGRMIKPKAPFLLDKDEKHQFCQILKDLKLPSNFSSNLSNIVSVNPPSLHSIKSHDYHVIVEYLLPVLLQHAFPKYRDLRRAIQQISLFFNLLCSKIMIRKDIQRAKYMVVEALCVLEKYFPPSFFDISIHLMVHLADEALICGPVGPRWMFPFERQMKDFKDIPSNKRYIEGSIAESYIVGESVRYCMEYMPNSLDGNHKRTRQAFLEENGEFSDEGPLLDDVVIKLEPQQFQQIRRWMLFRLEYKLFLTYIIHSITQLLLSKETETKAMMWRLVQGPRHEAKSYKKYRVNGFVFSPKYHDDIVVTQDSGVCMKAWTTFRAKKGDKRLKDAWTMWYGVIKQILELDCTLFKEVVFYCDWVRVEDKVNGCKHCPDSNLVMVNFDKFKSCSSELDEPVILASEATQVFNSKDLKNRDHSKQWSSRTGDFVRAHIPISYKDFRDVPNNFKDDVWNALM